MNYILEKYWSKLCVNSQTSINQPVDNHTSSGETLTALPFYSLQKKQVRLQSQAALYIEIIIPIKVLTNFLGSNDELEQAWSCLISETTYPYIPGDRSLVAAHLQMFSFSFFLFLILSLPTPATGVWLLQQAHQMICNVAWRNATKIFTWNLIFPSFVLLFFAIIPCWICVTPSRGGRVSSRAFQKCRHSPRSEDCVS